jgi:hypothetical protein
LLTLSYAAMVRKLGLLTALGVVVDGALPAALAVARLIDRGRIERSGLSAADLSSALAEYRGGSRWKPAKSIERALEHAIAVKTGLESPPAAQAAWTMGENRTASFFR